MIKSITNKVTKTVKYVNTGEVNSGDENTILYSGAIGSCVVICMYNSENKTGAMAHIMLPGSAPEGKEFNNMKYAASAIEKLLILIKKDKCGTNQIETCIIGGANVLKRKNDTIGKNNIGSVEKLLAEHGIKICEKSVGGFERRTVEFDVGKRLICYTEGDSKKQVLWKTGSDL